MILNIAIAVIILLVVVSTPRASDFETFPRVVLFATIFSVAINISSTRLILSGTMGAGHKLANQSFMVQAFANIVYAIRAAAATFIIICISPAKSANAPSASKMLRFRIFTFPMVLK